MKYFARTLYFLLALILVSCTLPTRTPLSLQATITDPSNNYLMSVGQTTTLAGFVRSEIDPDPRFTGSSISQVVFYGNGVEVARDTSPTYNGGEGYPTIWGNAPFTPRTAGEYQLQMEGYLADPGGDAGPISPNVRLCVLDGGDWLPSGIGYEGPCEMPTPRPDAPTEGEVQLIASVSVEPLYYWVEGCPEPRYASQISFLADLRDQPDRLFFVYADYGLEFNDGTSDNVARTKVFLNYVGPGRTLEEAYSGNSPDLGPELFNTFGTSGGNIRIEMFGVGPFGSRVADSLLIQAVPCGAGGKADEEPTTTPETNASIDVTITPAGPLTFTLNRDAICRAGPSLDYKIAEYISNGDRVQAYARSENAAWLVVLLQNGVRCWVSLQNGTPDGDPNSLPTEKAPDLVIPPTKTSGGTSGAVDADGDGYTSDVDCNDSTDKINPGAYEYPADGLDSNCNGDDNS